MNGIELYEWLRDHPDLCPHCRIAKWRSVSLSSAATPTRGRKS